MNPTSQTFEVRGHRETAVVRELANVAAGIKNPSGALVFVSGALDRRLHELADAIAKAQLGIPVLLAAGTGVLTERGEIEAETAATGVVWNGAQATLCALSTDARDVELGETLAKWLTASCGSETTSALLFAQPKGFTPEAFGPLRRCHLPPIAGAGTVGPEGVVGVDPSGQLQSGNVVACLFGNCARPIIKASHPCRYLTRMLPITAARGALLLEIDGRSALEVLSEAGEATEGRPLVMTILAAQERDDSLAEEVLIRGVQGIDPGHGALLISDEIRVGHRIAFGIRDAERAREELTQRLREAARECAGSAPAFGLYFNCSGRGRTMYGGATSVDSRMIADRFPGLPVCGLHSAFEIAPYDGGPALQLYNGVFALFSRPS